MITLVLDASTYTGDVAVIADGRVLAEATTAMKGADEERLMPAVARALEQAGLRMADVDRVVCGEGPGSFTSLRIAGAIAKGIAFGVGRPLFAVPSMALIVGGANVPPGRYLVAVDALRDELYIGLYDVLASMTLHEIERPRLIGSAELDVIVAEYDARVVSPSRGIGSIVSLPRARSVIGLEQLLEERGPVDLGRWEPSYGRLAEAQVRWEATHGRPLPVE